MESDLPNPAADADDTLIGGLRRVLGELDGIPEHVQIAARAALDWRTIDAELARLIHDSRVDQPALAVRGTTTPRALTFEAGELQIEIEAEPVDGGETLRIAGQLVPPQSAQITLLQGDDLIATRADERGRFAASGIVPGPLALRCRLDGPAGGDRLVETAELSI